MERDKLIKELKELGYPLIEYKDSINANEILAEVVRSRDPRLWQGFPILLANALERNSFSYQKTLSNLTKSKNKKALLALVIMSMALYKYLNIKPSNVGDVYKADFFDINKFNSFLSDIQNYKDIDELKNEISTRSIINTFTNYYRPMDININVKEIINVIEEFDIEFAMSQIFSKKQKDLIIKKLKGEKMTKTEREYYSRTVRKKISAIANPDLHKLATKLAKE